MKAAPPLLALHAIPYYLLGLVLMYFLSFRLQWFPIFGGYTAGTFPTFSLEFALDQGEVEVISDGSRTFLTIPAATPAP